MLDHLQNDISIYQGKELPEEWKNDLIEKCYFKLFLPKHLGGKQFNLTDAGKCLVATAKINASLGWVHNLIAGANYFCYFFSQETANKLFSVKNAITCGSGQVNGAVTSKNNQFIIHGNWSKCSGADLATYFTVNAKDENGVVRSYLVPKEFVTIKKDWKSFGLQLTSTDSIEIENGIIPKSYQFEIGNLKWGEHYYVAKLNFELFARFCLSATLEGIFRGMLNAFCTDFLPAKNKKTEEIVNHAFAKADELNTKRTAIDKELQKQFDFSDEITFNALNQFCSLANIHLELYEIASKLYFYAGIRASETTNLFHWWYRDFQTACLHHFVRPN